MILSQPKTPEPIVAKFEWCDYVEDVYHQKLGSLRPGVFGPHIGEIYTPCLKFTRLSTRRELQRPPGKHSRGALLWRKFLNFSFLNGTFWCTLYFLSDGGALKRRRVRGNLPFLFLPPLSTGLLEFFWLLCYEEESMTGDGGVAPPGAHGLDEPMEAAVVPPLVMLQSRNSARRHHPQHQHQQQQQQQQVKSQSSSV